MNLRLDRIGKKKGNMNFRLARIGKEGTRRNEMRCYDLDWSEVTAMLRLTKKKRRNRVTGG